MNKQNNESSAVLFYDEPQRVQCLNFLLHLAPYSNDLLLVYGEQGSGKTTLIKQFLSKANPVWDVCILEIQPELSASAVAEYIFSELKVSREEYDTASVLSLSSHFKTLQHRGRRPILVFDEAHLLTDKSLHFLDQLISATMTAEYGVSIIMFGEERLSKIVERTALKRHGLHSFELPPLEIEEITLFLHHHLKQAGIPKNRLSSSAIKEIAKKSNGNISLIKQYSHSYLHDSVESVVVPDQKRISKRKRLNKTKFSLLAILQWAAGLGIVLLLVLALIFQEQINRLVTTSPSDEDQITTIIEKGQITPFEPLPDHIADAAKPDKEPSRHSDIIHHTEIEQKPSLVSAEIENAPVPVSPEIEADVDRVPEVQLPPPPALPDSIAADINPKKPTEPVTQNPAPLKAEPVKISPTPPPPVKRDVTQDNAWLMARNAKNYTLQLMAMRKESSILNQLKNVENKSRYAIFSTQRKGRSLHILLYGDFSNSKAAALAQSELPAQLSKNKPWIRTFSGMQQELQKLEK